MSPLAPYTKLLGTRFSASLQYRMAAVAGAGTQFFWGFLMIVVYRTFYASSDAEPPMPWPMLVTYVWLGQMLLALLPWNHDREIEALVRRGDVVFELVRPVDLYGLWYARCLATRVAQASLRALPIALVAGFVLPGLGLPEWRLAAPPGVPSFVAFAAALAVAVALGCAITTLVHVSLLFTLSGEGISRLMPGLVTLFSGMVIPLPLFPEWVQPVLRALPFCSLADVPYRLWTGHLPPEAGVEMVAQGLAWTVVFVVAGRRMLVRATRRMVVQGG